MNRHRRQTRLASALASALLLAAPSASASVIHFTFVSGDIRGDLSFAESTFVPGPLNPTQYGYYFTTAALAFGPFDQAPTMSIPLQDAVILVQNNLGSAGTRSYSAFDEIRVTTMGPYASYGFEFFQFFNAPSHGFLETLSLSNPLPSFFPIVCPSETIPCRDGQAPLNAGTDYSWTFAGTRRNIDFVEASIDTPVPEPGTGVLLSVGAAAALAWRRLTLGIRARGLSARSRAI